MITKNFKIWSSSIMAMSGGADTVNLPQPITDVNGVEQSVNFLYNSLQVRSTFYNKNAISVADTEMGCCLLVGTNDETPTENDYTINAIDTISSVVAQTITRVIENDGKFAMQITRTLKNTAEEDITIKELGLFHSMEYTSSRAKTSFLMAREVLETPLVVPSGANFTVSMIVKV